MVVQWWKEGSSKEFIAIMKTANQKLSETLALT